MSCEVATGPGPDILGMLDMSVRRNGYGRQVGVVEAMSRRAARSGTISRGVHPRPRSSTKTGQTPKLSPASATTRWLRQGPHIGLASTREMTDDHRVAPALPGAAGAVGERSVNIRSASFRDLARIEQLYREATKDDDTVPRPGPRQPGPQAALLRLWQALTRRCRRWCRSRRTSPGDARRRGRRRKAWSGSCRLSRCRSPGGRGRSSTCARSRRRRTFRSRGAARRRVQPRPRAGRPARPRPASARPSAGRPSSSSTGTRSSGPSRSSIGTGAIAKPDTSARSTLIVPRAARTSARSTSCTCESRHPHRRFEGPSLKTWQVGVRARPRRRDRPRQRATPGRRASRCCRLGGDPSSERPHSRRALSMMVTRP